ncbi:hypothetical protein KBX06_23385 [Micromonospora sp. C31]|uniref:hypothetical protein n=1 Tax=Micromonospora sp. C31 TaxID=2824876 RepID=UPI001B3728D7|nr:hypothetical protein [Micromonospora sp. C31]MBQ1076079.1 hypothetical protein [Micromonospora sp. C31]
MTSSPSRRAGWPRTPLHLQLRRICTLVGGENTSLQLKATPLHPQSRRLGRRPLGHAEAVTAAQRATESGVSSVRVAALRRAVDVYRGQLADLAGHLWLAPHRDLVTRGFVAAALTLAEALADQPFEANSALDAVALQHPDHELLAAAHAATRRRSG